MKINVTAPCAVVCGCLLGALPAHANLLVNGGFEGGTLTPWTVTGTVFGSVANSVVHVHSGTYAIGFGPGSTDTISQTVTTVIGQKYEINFWLDSTIASIPFAVTFGGITLSNPPNPLLNTGGYQNYDDIITATSTSMVLTFSTHPGDPNGTYQPSLDDVRVTAVPEPASAIAGTLLLAPLALGALRKLRANRVA